MVCLCAIIILHSPNSQAQPTLKLCCKFQSLLSNFSGGICAGHHLIMLANESNISPLLCNWVCIYQNIHGLREVKSVSGKGKGIPQALRAFARLLSITSREELIDLGTEAALTDGRLARRPLKSTQSEIRAHCILVSRLNHMIQGHEVSVKVLESTDSDTNSRLALRRQLAKDLLFGELRVLKSASAWLTEYCSSLSAFSGR